VVRTIDAYPTATSGFNSSAGLAVGPDGRIFVGYDVLQKVTELDSSGGPVREFGTRAPSEIINASGYLAVGPSGRLYLDQEPARGNASPVLAYEADSTFITGILGNGEGDGQVIWPTGLAFDANGDLYVADVGQVLTGNGQGRIQKFHLEPPLSP
jgi:hypothetical protein